MNAIAFKFGPSDCTSYEIAFFNYPMTKNDKMQVNDDPYFFNIIELSDENPRPCVYGSCNKIVWVEKNMTQELRKWMNLKKNKKVRSDEEIMLVPTCTCYSCPLKYVERQSYEFTIVTIKTNKFLGTMKYKIKFCTAC